MTTGRRGPWIAVAAVTTALTVAPGAAGLAQMPRTCQVFVDRTGGTGRSIDVGGGFIRTFQSGGIWAHCVGQETRWYADSAAWYPDLNRFDMVGHVDFSDSTAQLRSERASYFLADERLEATGNARLTNRLTGSVLRGPQLTYRRRVSGVRDTTELTACSRPTVEYRSERDTAGAEPYRIVGDCVLLHGDNAASARGHVTIDRSDFHGVADSATLDTQAETGRLMSRARVAGGDSSGYALTGRDIRYRLTARQLTWVQAEGDADATSAEWRVRADTLQFDIRDDRIQAGIAWGDSTRASATSVTSTITADSLAIDAPGQILEEVRGVGDAQATSRTDSLDIGNDWVAGDTVTARFAATSTGKRGLAEIVALGAARAHYRVFPATDPLGPPDISYSRGARIVARFIDERLARVDVVGQTDGVYLESRRRHP
jgi:lipopolysaccharide export system protein LptA